MHSLGMGVHIFRAWSNDVYQIVYHTAAKFLIFFHMCHSYIISFTQLHLDDKSKFYPFSAVTKKEDFTDALKTKV